MATNGLFHKTLMMMGGNMAALVLQAVQFLLLARTLGAAQFGGFAAITAVINIAVPLAGLGYGSVMLMTVSRDRSTASVQLGNSLAISAGLGLLLIGVVLVAVKLLYGSKGDLLLALLIGFSELVLVRASILAGQFFQSIDKIQRFSLINVSISACRVIAIGALWITDLPHAVNWAMCSATLLLIVALIHVLAAAKEAGGLHFCARRLREQLHAAFYFAMGTTAKAAYTDLDKVMLGRFSPSIELGLYTTAYRLVVMAFIPVRSLLDVAASRFFKSGQGGVAHSFALSKQLLKVSVPYGLTVGIALFLIAPLVPWLLGPSYADSANVLRWLAPLPAIQTIHYVLSDALTGAGYQRLRTKIQFIILAVYAGLGFWLIPLHGWHGAAAVCLISESLLALLIIISVRTLLRTSST